MTTDLFPDLQIVRATVLTADGYKHSAQVAAVETDWMGSPVNLRKYTVRRVKLMLLQAGALCLTCADSYDAYPPECVLHARPRVTYWDGRVAYPVTDDTLRMYEPSTRFNLIAVIPPEDQPDLPIRRWSTTTQYAGLELVADEWVGRPLAERHKHMQAVVDQVMEWHPETDRRRLRTLIFDGKREHPYTFNWAAVQVDQSR